MSANATYTGSESSPTAPPSLNAVIHPLLNFLVLAQTFSSLLVPLFISLFYFSTPQGRRKPIFMLNVVAILLAFMVCVLCVGITIHSILYPLNPWRSPVHLAVRFICSFQSIIVDLALLFRVVSVYPLAQLGPIRFSLLIAIPVLLKLLRIINLIVFTKVSVDVMKGSNTLVVIESAFSSAPYVKIEWGSQLIDNTYASVVFLLRLHPQGRNRFVIISDGVALPQRIRTLFNIALTNFVVPAIFSIVQYVYVYRKVSMVVLDLIVLVNTVLTTFGVAFATVWAGNANRQEAQILDPKHNNTANNLTNPLGGGAVLRDLVFGCDDRRFEAHGELSR